MYADECVAVGLQPLKIFARRLNIGMVDALYGTSYGSQLLPKKRSIRSNHLNMSTYFLLALEALTSIS